MEENPTEGHDDRVKWWLRQGQVTGLFLEGPEPEPGKGVVLLAVINERATGLLATALHAPSARFHFPRLVLESSAPIQNGNEVIQL